jgi:5'-3' exonuclease
MLDRQRRKVYDEEAVKAKYGVPPASIADWLALVGDAADGYPGLPGWGEKSAARVLEAFKTIEAIPTDVKQWPPNLVRGADRLVATLAARRDEALLYKRLATLRTDVPLAESVGDLEYKGARPELRAFCERIGFSAFLERVTIWA